MAGPIEYAPSGRHPLLEAGYRVCESGLCERARRRCVLAHCRGPRAVEGGRGQSRAPQPFVAGCPAWWLHLPARSQRQVEAGRLLISTSWRLRHTRGAPLCRGPRLCARYGGAYGGVAARWATGTGSLTRPLFSHRVTHSQLLMRRNSVYIAFILGGAMVGERVSVWASDEKRTSTHNAPHPCAPPFSTPSLTSAPSLSSLKNNEKGRRLRHQLGLEVQQQGQAVRGLRGGGHDRRRDGRGRVRVKGWDGWMERESVLLERGVRARARAHGHGKRERAGLL